VNENDNPKKQILVIEDNIADVELLRLAMEAAGLDCDLFVIDDGGEALAFVRQQGKHSNRLVPDLVILDLNVPKSDGIEILKAIRDTGALAHLPVVVTTSSSSPREMTQLEALQIARHFIKPPDLEEFMKIGLILKEVLSSGPIPSKSLAAEG
jgi:CheY-like chemotaxis protein